MNAVGIDVSKGKSTVVALAPGGKFLSRPFDLLQTKSGIKELVSLVRTLDGDTRILMEHTGRYYEPLLQWLAASDLFVTAVNPKLIKDFGNNTLRKVKTDKADAKKIARYALDNWCDLRQHTGMDTTRTQLKTMNRQFAFCMKQKTACKNNLIALIGQVYPGANTYFESPARADGSQKWVDYVLTFWHVDYVCSMTLSTFTERYRKWCHRHGYNFQPDKPGLLMEKAKDLIAMLPMDKTTKMLVQTSIAQLNVLSKTVEALRTQVIALAEQLPEYPVVIDRNGVGPTLDNQLIAEIGDITRFPRRSSLTAFASVDPGAKQSGTMQVKSNKTSKAGSPHLRRALFQIVSGLLMRSPDDAVYNFMDKKRSEGKPYYVYMTAGANKFLRIYYGRVNEYLASCPKDHE